MKRCSALELDDQGFTIIEIMMVIAIIAILSAIIVPDLLSYRIRAYNAAAKEEAANAYLMARAYFEDFPNTAAIDAPRLEAAGMTRTPNIYLFARGGQEELVIRTSHYQGNRFYSVDSGGKIE